MSRKTYRRPRHIKTFEIRDPKTGNTIRSGMSYPKACDTADSEVYDGDTYADVEVYREDGVGPIYRARI